MFCNAYPGSFLVQIEREKAKHAKEMSGLEKQIAQLKDQLDKARYGLQDHVIFYFLLVHEFMRDLPLFKAIFNSRQHFFDNPLVLLIALWSTLLLSDILTRESYLQLASARAPLQAKIADMKDDMEHLQDKFNKVKAENERV